MRVEVRVSILSCSQVNHQHQPLTPYVEITHFGSSSFIFETLPFCFISSVVAPVIRNPREETITVEVSHSVTLTCEASGVARCPGRLEVWEHPHLQPEQPLPDGHQRLTLPQGGAGHRLGQLLPCIAKNTAGIDTRVITLNVIGGI